MYRICKIFCFRNPKAQRCSQNLCSFRACGEHVADSNILSPKCCLLEHCKSLVSAFKSQVYSLFQFSTVSYARIAGTPFLPNSTIFLTTSSQFPHILAASRLQGAWFACLWQLFCVGSAPRDRRPKHSLRLRLRLEDSVVRLRGFMSPEMPLRCETWSEFSIQTHCTG